MIGVLDAWDQLFKEDGNLVDGGDTSYGNPGETLDDIFPFDLDTGFRLQPSSGIEDPVIETHDTLAIVDKQQAHLSHRESTVAEYRQTIVKFASVERRVPYRRLVWTYACIDFTDT